MFCILLLSCLIKSAIFWTAFSILQLLRRICAILFICFQRRPFGLTLRKVSFLWTWRCVSVRNVHLLVPLLSLHLQHVLLHSLATWFGPPVSSDFSAAHYWNPEDPERLDVLQQQLFPAIWRSEPSAFLLLAIFCDQSFLLHTWFFGLVLGFLLFAHSLTSTCAWAAIQFCMSIIQIKIRSDSVSPLETGVFHKVLKSQPEVCFKLLPLLQLAAHSWNPELVVMFIWKKL